MPMTKDFFISVDIETSGPNPGTYSLLSIGACSVNDTTKTFYVEIMPINNNKRADALKISGLDWDQLCKEGLHPKEAMSQFDLWIRSFTPKETHPIFMAFNAPFDWMFVNDYFYRYLGYNPFGYKAFDIKAFYMGLKMVSWNQTGFQKLAQEYIGNRTLSHHALQDALDQAEIFHSLLENVNSQ